MTRLEGSNAMNHLLKLLAANILLEKEGEETGASPPAPDPNTDDKKHETLLAELERRLEAKGNNSEAVGLELIRNHRSVVAENGLLRNDIAELKKSALQDGQVASSQQDADALEAYKALGSIEDLTALKNGNSEAATELADLKAKDIARAAAKELSLDGDLLHRALSKESVGLELDESDKEKSFYNVVSGEGDSKKTTALTEWIEQQQEFYNFGQPSKKQAIRGGGSNAQKPEVGSSAKDRYTPKEREKL